MSRIYLLLFSFLIPEQVQFSVGPISLNIPRLLMIIFFPYICYEIFLHRRKFRWHSFDFLALAVCCWPIIAYTINSNFFIAIESGGVIFLELFVPFFLTRIVVRRVDQLYEFSKVFLLVVLGVVLLGIPEAMTGKNYLHSMASSVTGNMVDLNSEKRLGVWRTAGPFSHQIFFGAFCVVGLVVAVSLAMRRSKYWLFVVASAVGTFIAASSGPILAALSQVMLLVWSRLWTGHRYKWLFLLVVVVLAYIAIDILSDRDPLRVMFTYMLLNSHNGYVRFNMWVYSIELANANAFSMLFGYGNSTDMFEGVSSLFFRGLMSESVDSYWLVQLLRYGWPMLLLQAGFVSTLLFATWKSVDRCRKRSYRRLIEAWFITAISLTLIAFTVHYWGHMASFYMMILALTQATRMKSTQSSLSRRH